VRGWHAITGARAMSAVRLTWTIFSKELLDTLRDRRTLFMMIGVPVLLYPALILLSLQVAVIQHEQLERRTTRVVVESPWPPLRLWLQERDRIKLVEAENPRAALDAGDVEVVVQTPDLDATALAENRTATIHLLYDATHFESLDGALRVEAVLAEMEKALLAERLQQAGISAEYIEPLNVAQVNVAPPEKTTGNLLGMVLPIMMVMMIALGAFYPAVDLTAGEKERGTFETLLSTPATKMTILLGKFHTVAVLALATGLLNLGSMAATFAVMLGQVKPLFEGDFALQLSLPWMSVLWIVLILIPFSGLISAVMMSIAVYAKSFKEAQNYVTPFLLIIMAPAMVALLPGAELSAPTALAPVLNVVLLFRALMVGDATVGMVLLVLASTVVFAGLAVSLAAWLFHREDVVLGDQTPSLFVKRARGEHADAVTPNAAIAFYLFMALLLFYGSGFLHEMEPISGLLVLQWGLLLLPALGFLRYFRINLRTALSLRPARSLAWGGMLLLTAGAVVLLMQYGIFQQRHFPAPSGLEETFSALFQNGMEQWGIPGVLFAMSITPAVCEEILFRGVLLSALRRVLPAAAVIMVVGVLFGAFHMSAHRFVSTAAIGVLLTYVCLRSGSIYLSIAMHALINGSSVLVATGALPAFLRDRIDPVQLQEHGVPWPALALAAGCALIGLAILEYSTHAPRWTWRRIRGAGRGSAA
jgi:sodium transport system permease protein